MANPNAPVLRLVDKGDAAYKKKNYEAAKKFYEQALEIALKKGGDTNFVYSSLAKVFKKLKMYKEAYEISRQICTPAGFRDSAISLRQLAKQAQKTNDDTTIRNILNEFYKLAVLAYLCYGPFDCKGGVRGALYDRAAILCQRIDLKQIHATYQTHGIISGGGILTENDYKMFSAIFGETSRTYNPHQDFVALTKAINEAFIKSMYESWHSTEFGDDPFMVRMRDDSIAETLKWLRENAPFAIND